MTTTGTAAVGTVGRPGDRLAAAFAAAAGQSRAALVGYLPAGYPDRASSVDAFRAIVDGGVDVVEVGLPYSDPLMDGPVIAGAVDAALAAGTSVRDVLDTVAAVAALGVPVLLMTYWNPVARYGVAAFSAALADAGAAGMITPDLVPEEGADWLVAADRHGLAPVFLVAPTSTDDRIAAIGRVNRGFVYAASTMGVTGPREDMGERAPALVRRVRRLVPLPVAVGLGVSDRKQAAEVAAYADGVIVGSAFVRRLLDAPTRAAGTAAVAALAGELAAGVRER